MVKQNSLSKKQISHFTVILIVEHLVIGSSGFEIWNVRLFTAHATVALRHHFREKKSTYVVFWSNYTTAMR